MCIATWTYFFFSFFFSQKKQKWGIKNSPIIQKTGETTLETKKMVRWPTNSCLSLFFERIVRDHLLLGLLSQWDSPRIAVEFIFVEILDFSASQRKYFCFRITHFRFFFLFIVFIASVRDRQKLLSPWLYISKCSSLNKSTWPRLKERLQKYERFQSTWSCGKSFFYKILSKRTYVMRAGKEKWRRKVETETIYGKMSVSILGITDQDRFHRDKLSGKVIF